MNKSSSTARTCNETDSSCHNFTQALESFLPSFLSFFWYSSCCSADGSTAFFLRFRIARVQKDPDPTESRSTDFWSVVKTGVPTRRDATAAAALLLSYFDGRSRKLQNRRGKAGGGSGFKQEEKTLLTIKKRHNKRQQQTYLQSAWLAKTIGSSIAHWARQQLCTLCRCNLRPRATRARAHTEDELLLPALNRFCLSLADSRSKSKPDSGA